MRFKGCLLTRAESLDLMDRVDAWCRETGTNYNRLVVAAGVGVSLRSMVRTKGRRVTKATAALVSKAMMENPRGIEWSDHKRRVARRRDSLRAEITRQVRVEVQRVDRTPCPKCGVRADKHEEFGCSRDFERQGYSGYQVRYG